MADQLNELLADRAMWTPAARELAQRKYAEPVVRAFYDVLAPPATDFFATRERVLPLPGRDDGFARVMLLGTFGAGKTTLVRQLIGTDPERERFPSTSASKTTTADIELVLRPGSYRAVVTFLPKEQARAYTEDCVLAAVLAVVDGRDDAEVARRLLEHRDQKFRLSYVLGTLAGVDTGNADDDGDLDDEDDADAEGAEELGVDVAADPDLPLRVPAYVTDIRGLADRAAGDLGDALGVAPAGATGADRDAFEELLEEHLRADERFHELVDRVLDDVEARFALLRDGDLQARSDGWPVAFAFDAGDDRETFVARVNRFSSNNARLFGRLLTPLVQGIRVAAPFAPGWTGGEVPPLVLIDGEGFGHTSNTLTSLPSEMMRRLDDVDAVLLVDNAAQPMQAGPGVILRSLITAGHEAKLRVAFTKFDLVRGANLGDMTARQNHVRASLDQAVAAVGKLLSRSAERTLHRALEGRVFFLSDIRRAPDELSRFTRAQLDGLLASLRASVTPAAAPQAAPVYDEANLVLAMQRAMQGFHEAWHARLGLPSRASLPKEHWTRVKAMTRWISQLNQEGYDTLTPVADLEQAIRDRVYVFLENPVTWRPPTDDPDQKALAVAAVCAEVNARLREFSLRRVIEQRFPDWADAFTAHSGTGSTWRRARAIDGIYDIAAPVPGETPDGYGNEFLREVRALVREAIRAAGGEVLNVAA